MAEGTVHTVCKTGDIDPGKCEIFELDGQEIIVAQTKQGDFYAVSAICPHANAKMEGARVRGSSILCPLHGARFDMRDGSYGPPAFSKLKTYELEVDGEDIKVTVTPEDTSSRGPVGMF